MQARTRGRDVIHVPDPLGGLQEGMNQDRFRDAVLGFELRQQLVHEVNVPGSLDLRDDDDIELVADRGDDLHHVVEEPRAVQRVDAGPQGGVAEIGILGHPDEAGARRLLGLGGDGVLQVAAEHIHLLRGLRKSCADLFDVRREEMDHPLRTDG